MDMSFGIQALCLEYLAKNGSGLTPNVYDVPKSIDESVARLKLASMGLKTDSLTPDQEEYLTGF
jgi:adenosylhomocysteinase